MESLEATIAAAIATFGMATVSDAHAQVQPLQELPPSLGPKELAQCIDHTLLKLDATEAQIDELCKEARVWGFKTVCVRLSFVARAVHNLRGTGVGVACVVGFHEGTYSTEEKLSEATAALAAGATELDIVLNHPLLVPSFQKNADQSLGNANSAHTTTSSFDRTALSTIRTELHALRALQYPTPQHTTPPPPPTLKLILETSALAPHFYPTLLIAATALAHDADFDFVKTSTGFAGHGARVQDVRVMRGVSECLAARDAAAGKSARAMRVKASGGIRTLTDAKEMVAAGARRLGVSAGVAIVQEAQGEPGRGGGAGMDAGVGVGGSMGGGGDEESRRTDGY